MEKEKNKSIKNRKSAVRFNPNHSDLDIAIREFVKQGGIIRKINVHDSPNGPAELSLFINEADEFLMGL
jgi:hypothetical protein